MLSNLTDGHLWEHWQLCLEQCQVEQPFHDWWQTCRLFNLLLLFPASIISLWHCLMMLVVVLLGPVNGSVQQMSQHSCAVACDNARAKCLRLRATLSLPVDSWVPPRCRLRQRTSVDIPVACSSSVWMVFRLWLLRNESRIGMRNIFNAVEGMRCTLVLRGGSIKNCSRGICDEEWGVLNDFEFFELWGDCEPIGGGETRLVEHDFNL